MYFSKFVFLFFLLFFLFSGEINSNINFQEINLKYHKKTHFDPISMINAEQLEIGLIKDENNIKYFKCTSDVIEAAYLILQDRPCGSEVFVEFYERLVVEIVVCHEHDGVVLECGEELMCD